MKSTNSKQMLVTSALPYANGPLHLGHLVEHIQTDIWVRWQRILGHDVLSICGEDAHGTPIMIKAQELGVSPEAMIAENKTLHEADFNNFAINYDNYHTTHSEENKYYARLVYKRLNERGDIVKRTVKQAFDPIKNMFLPDRYVKGTCPKCGADDQYGDNCESCGATYSPSELKNPVSALTGATPIEKESEHYFFDLPKYANDLKTWQSQHNLQPEVVNKLQEWFEAGLQQWDISRDQPYFGIEIPNAPGKYFYVWMDAPIGYIASTQNYCEKNNKDLNHYWGTDSEVELYHFIGKDIMYFHALFWPAMLMGANFRTPTAIFTHGFLTVNGKKMSKSRGTFITAREYLDNLDATYLRYYFAAKLTPHVEDIDLNLHDFMLRVNSDLVGKVINIASRSAGFIYKKFDGILASECAEPELLQEFVAAGDEINDCYTNRDYARAVRTIMALADKANQYIDAQKPWVLAKEESQLDKVQAVCSVGLNCFRLLMLYLKPIVPVLAEKTESFLQCEALSFANRGDLLLSHKIDKFKPMLQRISDEQIEQLTQNESA